MTGKSLNLEFYSLIRIGFSDLTGEVEAAVMRHFGSFRVDQDREGRPQDIAVSELRGEAAAALDPFNREDTSGFWIKELGDDVYAVFGHRGRADVAIRLSSSLSLLYTRRSGCANKFIGILILCIQIVLQKKGGILFKGAVLVSGKRCVVLTGLSGSGKTAILLQMLRDGWNYLSNDRFILFRNRAHLFRRNIPVELHHIQILPWLLEKEVVRNRIAGGAGLRRWLRDLAVRRLPGSVLPPLSRYYDPSVYVDPKEISAGCGVIETADPSIWCVLVPGRTLSIREVDRRETISDLTIVQELSFPDFTRLGQLLTLYGCGTGHEVHGLIDSNIGEGQKFWKLTFPYRADFSGIYQNLSGFMGNSG